MNLKKLSFLTFSLLFLFALLFSPIGTYAGCGGGSGCGGGYGGSGSSSVIDPLPGQAFKDPVNLTDVNSDSDVFEANLEAKSGIVNINDVQANLLTYNGYYPGPTIWIKQGDTLKLHFKNLLPKTGTNILGYTRGITNIHTHGFHVSPEEPADAAHMAINSGDVYDYEYDTSMQPKGAMCFYHCHIHGLTAEQYWAGLAGTIIVEDPTNLLAGYETHTMVIKDISLSGNQPTPYSSPMDYMKGKEGTIVMVNGQVNPVLNVRPGQVQRWRILNACNARFLKLNLQQHGFQVIGADGGLLDKPYSMSEIVVAPGERLDLLVKAVQSSGTYKLLSLPYDRGCGTLQTVTLMTVVCKGSSVTNTIPSIINPDAKRLNIDTSSLVKRQMVLSMRMGRGYINGQDFDVNPYTIMSTVGTYEVWQISVQGGMDHPFHFHINHAQVLSISGGDPGYASLYTKSPAWKDTIVVPQMGGTITLLVSIQDWTGMTMFHCHIVEHEDIGMMGMWHIMPMDEM